MLFSPFFCCQSSPLSVSVSVNMVECPKRLAVCLFLCLAISQQGTKIPSFAFPASSQDHEGPATSRIIRQEQGNMHEVHCSRERSRAAWKIIEEYLMPFVEKERYQISSRCKLHPQNDMYRDQEQHKSHEDINEWRCGYCKKTFYEEKYLDKHFDNRHYNLLNVSDGKCLADACSALHCDLVMDSVPHKTKCNPAAAARNKHLCESLAESCFPVNEGPSARRLNELFLRQFCDAHTCTGSRRPFSKGGKKKRSMLYIIVSVLTVMLLSLFYLFLYLYLRGIKRGTQGLKRISKGGQKKKPS